MLIFGPPKDHQVAQVFFLLETNAKASFDHLRKSQEFLGQVIS